MAAERSVKKAPGVVRNGSSAHTGVPLLDGYIAAHYEAVQQYGELTILRRRDLRRRQ
ncbi:MAG TPA: hypothetical protein VN734_17030 [Acidobacteriaceae bacterium]|nr:hypothetical protein [Acidobacteriaceae bacterium]